MDYQEETGWKEHTSLVGEGFAVTSIEYDNYFDMVWTGYANGRVTGFSIKEEQYDAVNMIETQPLSRYSSFGAVPDMITRIVPNQHNIVCFGQSKISLRGYGGVSMGTINLDVNTYQSYYTCGDGVRSPSISRTSASSFATSIVAGTSSNWAFLYDLTVPHDTPVMTYNVVSPSIQMLSNGHLIVAAGYDGSLRLLDGKFRSSEVLTTLEAHLGSIKDVYLQDDGRTLISCGMVSKPNAPSYQYTVDPQIKVFDLRMQRQLSVLPIETPPSSTGVRFLRFLQEPRSSVIASETVPAATSVVLATEDGVIQVNDLISEGGLASPQIFYAPVSDSTHEFVSACGVSASGQFLSVGTTLGTFGQYCLPVVEPESDKTILRVNEVSPNHKTVPKNPAPPLMTLPPDALVLGTAYVLRPPGKDQQPQYLSSLYDSTPQIMKKKVQLSSGRIICDDILTKMTRHDFIGSVRNPGYRPNSMIFTLPGKPQGYSNCDPRKQDQNQYSSAGNNAGGGNAASSHIGNSGNRGVAHRSPNLGGQDGTASPVPGLSLPQPLGASLMPQHYWHQRSSNAGNKQQRYLKFNYSQSNKTSYVGLENNVPHSYVNSILQILYSFSSVRNQALRSQVSSYHHQEANQYTLWCELGFLFHMLQQIESQIAEDPKGEHTEKMVRPANFQRTFQTYQLLPEVAAMGLFDPSVQKDQQLLIQTFTQFILRHLTKELETERKSGAAGGRFESVLDQLCGFSVRSSTTFLQSGTVKVDPTTARLLFVEAVYPSLSVKQIIKPGATSPVPAKKVNRSFAAVLWGSLQKESFMKGWCQESESFEPFKKMLSVESLPQVLTLFCGDTQRDTKDTTLAGALGEASNQGNALSNFWSKYVSDTLWGGAAASEGDSAIKPQDISWLPVELEVAYLTSLDPLPSQFKRGSSGSSVKITGDVSKGPASPTAGGSTSSSRLIVSCRCIEIGNSSGGGALSTEKEGIAQQQETVGGNQARWIVFDGTSEKYTKAPASQLTSEYNIVTSPGRGSAAGESNEVWKVVNFQLSGVVSQISDPFAENDKDASSGANKHIVAHIAKTAVDPENDDRPSLSSSSGTSSSSEVKQWHLFNDFLVQPAPLKEVVTFSVWRHPCVIFFSIENAGMETINGIPVRPPSPDSFATEYVIPQSILQLESLSHIPCIRMQSFASIPGPGDLIAFDGEFVSVALEKSAINATGQRVMSEEGRQVLARISLLDAGQVMLAKADTTSGGGSSAASVGSVHSATGSGVSGGASGGMMITPPDAQSSNLMTKQSYASGSFFNKNMMRILADDYILPVEPVLDYVTRFSGITEDDLNPHTSKHAVVTHRTAYLKLRYFIDRKCIFVGHGLEKDFETANIYVPPEQIKDTVDLWRLPKQRKISLRFLASYLLKEDIQDEIHDSIEDAKTALLLYRHYETVAAQGPEVLAATLKDLYDFGNRSNWTIGLDRLHVNN